MSSFDDRLEYAKPFEHAVRHYVADLYEARARERTWTSYADKDYAWEQTESREATVESREQARGIDAFVTSCNWVEGDETLAVEVKAQPAAGRTGNVFLEYERGGREGWAVASSADLFAIALPHACEVVFLSSDTLVELALDDEIPSAISRRSVGRLVPVETLRKRALRVVELDRDERGVSLGRTICASCGEPAEAEDFLNGDAVAVCELCDPNGFVVEELDCWDH